VRLARAFVPVEVAAAAWTDAAALLVVNGSERNLDAQRAFGSGQQVDRLALQRIPLLVLAALVGIVSDEITASRAPESGKSNGSRQRAHSSRAVASTVPESRMTSPSIGKMARRCGGAEKSTSESPTIIDSNGTSASTSSART
jgi:hypothetical protein